MYKLLIIYIYTHTKKRINYVCAVYVDRCKTMIAQKQTVFSAN